MFKNLGKFSSRVLREQDGKLDSNSDCEECVQTCAVDNSDTPCKCSGKSKLNNELITYFVSMQVDKPTNLRDDQLKKFSDNQLSRALREYVTPLQDAKIIHYESLQSGAELTYRFSSSRRDEKKIRASVGKWKEHGHVGGMNLTHKDTVSFSTDPLISLQGININQVGPIRENNDFILSCVAKGSPNVVFRWFKDGVFVNVSTSSSGYKWSRLIEDPNVKDQYTELLGVDKASALDQGLFTCQIVDHGVQQCLSKRVEVRSPPLVWVEPMSLTVRKGENFTVKCFSASSGKQKIKYTYSWTKNRILLPIQTDNEHYEVLYPMGSILQVSSINKSTTFSCLVQDELVSSEMSISVTVVYGEDPILTCPGESHLDVLWPETAPGTESLQECPREHSGVARRFCGIRDTGRPIWQMPDYSDCTPIALREVITQFQKLKHGYSSSTPSEILIGYLQYLEGLSDILPGVGARVLSLVDDVITFISDTTNVSGSDATNETTKQSKDLSTTILRIVDKILQCKYSLTNESQIVLMQQVVRNQALLAKIGQHPARRSFVTLDVTLAPPDNDNVATTFRVPSHENSSSYPRWFSYKLHLSLGVFSGNKSTARFALAVYRNLSALLPQRSVIRLKDGIEMEYEILSNIASVWILPNPPLTETTVTMEFLHLKNTTSDDWNINCAVSDFASYGYTWDLQNCRTRILDASASRCTCTRTGTFAVLMTKRPTIASPADDPVRQHVIVLAGCCTCLILSTASAALLTTHWALSRSCIGFIKLQCCSTIIGAMVVFVYAIWRELTDPSSFLYLMSFLESFLLTAMSSQLSKLLVVYTEIVQLQRMGSIKQTVVLIITGAPLIAVFGNHLAHRSMNTKLTSWWLQIGSLSFNIFIACFVILIGLFCLVYNVTMKKMGAIKKKYDKQSHILDLRIKVVHRSACVFYSTTFMIFSSIAYVNFPNMMVCHYLFALFSMILGVSLLLCYVLYSEVSLRDMLRSGFRNIKGRKSLEGSSDPLKLYTKQKPETENDSPNYYFGKNGKAETHFTEAMCKHRVSEISSPTFKTYSSATFPEHSGIDCIDYANNPQQYMAISSMQAEVKCFHSPDILGSEKFVELDLVASSFQKNPPTSEIKAEIICIPTKVKLPQNPPIITITTEDSSKEEDDQRLQPEGQEKAQNAVNETVSGDNKIRFGDNLDEMMDKISHDLDYLLNDNELAVQKTLPSIQSMKRVSKSQVCIFEQIKEEPEEEVKVPESITNVSRTDC
ncbi:uncharacterized protein [Onthophagus taurus]|uniref:uncharacterized protein isoform X3 n=1 Tax=Onthophagus taurus TaxID=166361 RepID=UPI0039BDF4A7